MKRIFLPLLLTAIMVVAGAAIFTSCKKVVGPAGPAGKDGANGTNGTNGINGTNGADGLNGQNALNWCKTCHNTTTWGNAINQWLTSRHGTFATGASEGPRRDCAQCHSKQGFMECIATGLDTTSYNHMVGTTSYNAYGVGQPIDCEVCHTFHGTLDSADFPNYALRYMETYTTRFDHTITMNLGKSNLCVKCHQVRDSRRTNITPLWALDTVSTNLSDSLYITNMRFGGHDSPVAQNFGGMGYGCFEITGPASYANSPHKDLLSCGDCHVLSTAVGTLDGGHTFRMSDTSGNQNISKCVTCHTGATSFDINGDETLIKGLMLAIENKMIANGWLKANLTTPNGYGGMSDGSLYHNGATVNSTTNRLKVPEIYAAAIWDFKVVTIGGAYGVHNFLYEKALLMNIKALIGA